MIAEMKPIGALPEFEVKRDWRTLRLWQVADLRSEKNKPGAQLLSVFLHRGVIRYGEGGGQVHKPGLDLSTYQVVKQGDLVLNNQQAWRGSVGVSRYDGIISPAYVVMRLRGLITPRYGDYLFQSRCMVDQYITSSKGVGDIQRDVYLAWLKNVKVPVPPPDEQELIVRFLDWASVRLGKAIAAKRKVIRLLEEQKQVIIHRAVTRGLDNSVPLKPSGLDWLGDVPEHWNVKRIKYLMRVVENRSENGDEVLLSMRKYHGLVPYHEHFSKPPQAATLKGFKIIEKGQIATNRMQAGFGLIFESNQKGIVSPDFGVFQPTGEVIPEFLGLLFRSRNVRAKFHGESKGLGTGKSGFMRLYDDRIGWIHIAYPPTVNEQEFILKKLAGELDEIAKPRSTVEREIELLQEYRTRLITDVVTGKLDVREYARTLPAEIAEVAVELVSSERDDEFSDTDAEPADELTGEPA